MWWLMLSVNLTGNLPCDWKYPLENYASQHINRGILRQKKCTYIVGRARQYVVIIPEFSKTIVDKVPI